jgi:hypothetical protein
MAMNIKPWREHLGIMLPLAEEIAGIIEIAARICI